MTNLTMIDLSVQFAVGGGVVTAALAGLAGYATFVPGSRIWGPVVWQGASDGPPRMALTFDDGPTAGATDCILDILGEMKVKAAFFVIGRNVEREPDLLRRIDAEGHLVGNHTFDHSRWSSMGQGPFWRKQIEKTDAAIERVLGRRPLLFRPPVGHKTPYTMAAARRGGHAVVTWGVRAWDGVPTTAERIVEHVAPRCRAGTIVILHDGVEPNRPRDPSASIAAVRPLVAAIRERGLEPVRLDELTGLRAYAKTGNDK
jgi:peptidoglycan-N-acetylglucosamine deacetylase